MTKLSLGTRVMLGLMVFGAGLSFIAVQVVDLSNDVIENTILHGMMRAEMAELAALPPGVDPYPPGKPRLFQGYILPGDAAASATVPEALRGLAPGFHEDLEIAGRPQYIYVTEGAGRRNVLAYDITRLEETEDEQSFLLSMGAIGIILGSLLIGYFFARMLVAPINALARQVRTLDPAARGKRIATTSRMEEVSVIAGALNAFMERLDGFVEREHEFTATVSHELRTPIAVISTSTDVLGTLPRLPRAAARPIARIERATRDMEEVITALLYLAKEAGFEDKPRDTCDLTAVIAQVVEDHRHLIRDKKLELRLLQMEPALVSAPSSILLIAIGNIVRNAIEHTEQGVVEISVRDGVLTIRNTGPDLSPETVAQLFSDRFRDDAVRGVGKGLGIYIIKRICARFGWDFTIGSSDPSGTTVTLNLGSSLSMAEQTA